MSILQQGQNAALGGFPLKLSVRWANALPQGLDVDASVYLLGPDGKVRGDGDMIFYGQRVSGDGGTSLVATDAKGAFFQIVSLPDGVERAALTTVVDDTTGTGRGFSHAGTIEVTAEGPQGSHSYSIDAAATGFAAVILAEVYRRDGQVKMRAVGQGFAGGLKPLAEHFGVAVADNPPAPPPQKAAVSLEKKIVSLEKARPQMVSLLKKADQAVSRSGLSGARAKMYLCLDISGSMDPLYRAGKVDALTERVMALGYRLDDDGQIDVFLFGKNAHYYGQVGPSEVASFSRDLLRKHPLEGGTMYGQVMERIRSHYASDPDYGKIPVFVMFVTDGGTQDPRLTETQILEASREGIFWKFMAIGSSPKKWTGKKSKRLPAGFDFLAYLDDMQGRLVDNADFFSVEDPTKPTDDELYALLLEEFPAWLDNARRMSILAPSHDRT